MPKWSGSSPSQLFGQPRPAWRDAVHTWGLSAALLPVIAYCLVSYWSGIGTVFDTASLIIHEAGHVFFRPFGHVLFLLGGSLYQLILPGLCVYVFFRGAYRPGVQGALVWLGQNLLNVSTYVSDAQERSLPLITGDPSTHDWWQLLSAAGLLPYDDVIGSLVLGFGLVCFLASLLCPRVLP